MRERKGMTPKMFDWRRSRCQGSNSKFRFGWMEFVTPRGLPSGDVQEAVAYESPEFRGEI